MKICHFLLLISKKLVCFRSETLGEPENPISKSIQVLATEKEKSQIRSLQVGRYLRQSYEKQLQNLPWAQWNCSHLRKLYTKQLFFPPVSVPALKYRFSFINRVYGQPDLKTLYYGNPEADRGSKQFASYPEDGGHWEASQPPASPRSQHARA